MRGRKRLRTVRAAAHLLRHWRYLLTNTGSLLHLQCPGCTHVWVHESGFGATRSLWDRVSGALPGF